MLQKKLIACPYCDALYEKQLITKNQVLICDECHSVVDNGMSDLNVAFYFALTALILFIIANSFPFINLNLKGESNTISIFSSINSLYKNDLIILACTLTIFIIVIPLWYLLAIIWSIVSFRYKLINNLTRRFLHLMNKMSPWNMLEVYLMGVLVTLIKIMQMATVIFLPAFWAFICLIFFSLLLTHSFDLQDTIFVLNDEQNQE